MAKAPADRIGRIGKKLWFGSCITRLRAICGMKRRFLNRLASSGRIYGRQCANEWPAILEKKLRVISNQCPNDISRVLRSTTLSDISGWFEPGEKRGLTIQLPP